MAPTVVGPAGVLCRLRVPWPIPADRDRGETFFQLSEVRDGRITGIRGFDDRASALGALETPPA